VRNAAALFRTTASEAALWKADEHELHSRYVFAKNYLFRRLNAFQGGEESLRNSAAKAGLKFSLAAIQALDQTWNEAYAQAVRWMNAWVAECLTKRYTLCHEWGYGRVLHGQGIHIANKALDHVWQAGIAGLVNNATRLIWQEFGYVPVANMHDGLLYNVPDGKLEFVARRLKEHIEMPLRTLKGVRIRCNLQTGKRWGGAYMTTPAG
jgi:hypothetical protein